MRSLLFCLLPNIDAFARRSWYAYYLQSILKWDTGTVCTENIRACHYKVTSVTMHVVSHDPPVLQAMTGQDKPWITKRDSEMFVLSGVVIPQYAHQETLHLVWRRKRALRVQCSAYTWSVRSLSSCGQMFPDICLPQLLEVCNISSILRLSPS